MKSLSARTSTVIGAVILLLPIIIWLTSIFLHWQVNEILAISTVVMVIFGAGILLREWRKQKGYKAQ